MLFHSIVKCEDFLGLCRVFRRLFRDRNEKELNPFSPFSGGGDPVNSFKVGILVPLNSRSNRTWDSTASRGEKGPVAATFAPVARFRQ